MSQIIYDPVNNTWLVVNEEEQTDWWNFVTPEHVEWWNEELARPTADQWWNDTFQRSGDAWWNFDPAYGTGVWVQGAGRTLPIQWLYVQDWVPIDTDKEITDVDVIPATLAHEGGGHFDDYSLRPSLMMEKLYGTEVTHIPLEEITAGEMPIEIPFFGAVKDGLWAKIQSVDILPLANTSAGANDRVQFRVHNYDTGGTVCTRTIMQGDDLVKGDLMRFGGISEDHGYVAFGKGIYLTVEIPATYDGITIPRCMLVIQWDIAQLEA